MLRCCWRLELDDAEEVETKARSEAARLVLDATSLFFVLRSEGGRPEAREGDEEAPLRVRETQFEAGRLWACLLREIQCLST